MAEAVFQHMVNEAGLSDKISVDSAGTGSWHIGEPAHNGTLRILKQKGVAYDGRARQLAHSDLDQFDYVLAMDAENISDIRRHVANPKAEVRLFLDYAMKAGTVNRNEVPDPYYSGQYELVYSLVEPGCRALLEHIRAKHNL
jgi:protein-tyrosine phosphatase